MLAAVDSSEYVRAWIEAEMSILVARFAASDPWAWALCQSGEGLRHTEQGLLGSWPPGNDRLHTEVDTSVPCRG